MVPTKFPFEEMSRAKASTTNLVGTEKKVVSNVKNVLVGTARGGAHDLSRGGAGYVSRAWCLQFRRRDDGSHLSVAFGGAC